MKTNPKIVLTALVILAVTLSIVSASAFVWGSLNAASQSTTTSGTSGYHSNWMMGDQWGNMMGGNWGSPSGTSTPTPVANTAQNSVLPLIGFITLIGAASAGTGGAFYYFTSRPKIALSKQPTLNTVDSTPSVNAETPYDSVLKTLTGDERKVVGVLTSHNGQYLQKYIRAETGLSRLKVHRIVSRLAERGIVTLEQSGNTNKVYLSSWLAKQPFSKINPKENNKQEIMVEA
jgi:predicted transcriptional regulator